MARPRPREEPGGVHERVSSCFYIKVLDGLLTCPSRIITECFTCNQHDLIFELHFFVFVPYQAGQGKKSISKNHEPDGVEMMQPVLS